jgi:serine/threonine protein kinase
MVVVKTIAGESACCPLCGTALPVAKGEDALIGKIVAGCTIERRIGAGAQSVVYAALRKDGHKRCALKILSSQASADPENCRRFEREARLCQKITHPNVITVHEHGSDKNIHYMLMELVDGMSMEERIDQQGVMPWRQVAQLVMQLAQALERMRQIGIIHRDIKPANILLTKDGVAKLIDLGFAKKVDEHKAETEPSAKGGNGITMEGVSMGSPSYMPPEQVLDAKQATHAADIYSLGATFFHAVSGQTPFSGNSAYQVMENVLTKEPLDLAEIAPDVPVAIRQMIAWMMDKDAHKRPRTAGVVVRELDIAMFAPEEGHRIAKLRRGGRMWQVVAGVVAGVIFLGVIAWILIQVKGH